MTLAEVASALSASNVLVAVGRLEQYDKLYLVVSDTRFKKFDEIEHTVLRSTPDGVVLLDDVATVEHSTEPQWVRVTADGHDAVLFQVYQQPRETRSKSRAGSRRNYAKSESRFLMG